jgi:branched-chain amino acid transport system permease protein
VAATGTVSTVRTERRVGSLRAPLVIVGFLAVAFAWMGFDQFLNALTLGAVYALVALGYTMVYGIIELINFAHGDVFMVGTFVSMFVSGTLLQQKQGIHEIPLLLVSLVLVFALTIAIMGAIGAAIERFAYRPLRRAPRLAPLITAIGVSFILQNVIQYFVGPYTYNVPQLFPVDWAILVGETRVPFLNIFVIVVAVALMIVLQLFISRTRTGKAMRTTAMDRDASALMGVDIDRTIMITFLIGSGLAGAAGTIHGLYYGNTNFQLGFQSGLKAFTAAVLGGIGNTAGAALGGFIIAFVEVGAVVLGFSRWGGAVVFSLLVIFLVFRPTGLLGSHAADRA